MKEASKNLREKIIDDLTILPGQLPWIMTQAEWDEFKLDPESFRKPSIEEE
jgi:hypothetical protein